MKWKDEYATGVREIDDQHKMLFEATEVFREVVEEGSGESSYKGFLEFLVAYSDNHFTFEEDCMLAYKCPFAARNKTEHKNFMVQVSREVAVYQEKGFELARVIGVLDLVEGWLDSHICRIDVRLKDYVA